MKEKMSERKETDAQNSISSVKEQILDLEGSQNSLSNSAQGLNYEKAIDSLREPDRVQKWILEELKNSSGIQRRNFRIAVAAVIIAVISLIFIILTYLKT